MACMANITSQKAGFLGSQYQQMLGLQGGFAPLNLPQGALPLEPRAIGYPLSFTNYLLQQKKTRTLSALLISKGTAVDIINALLALSWRCESYNITAYCSLAVCNHVHQFPQSINTLKSHSQLLFSYRLEMLRRLYWVHVCIEEYWKDFKGKKP